MFNDATITDPNQVLVIQRSSSCAEFLPDNNPPPQFPKIDIPLTSPKDQSAYLKYLDNLSCWEINTIGRSLPKLLAQLIFRNEGIGDPSTILVAGSDQESLKHVVNGYLKGKPKRVPVCIGTCISNDGIDQAAPSRGRERAMFFENIFTDEDFRVQQQLLDQYVKKHPELIAKIFPQDGKQNSIGRILTTENGIIIQAKIHQLNGRDEEATKKKLVTIYVERDPITHKYSVISDEIPEAKAVIASLSTHRALRFFKTLQEEIWRLPTNVSLLNPEFMLNVSKQNLLYFTDLVYGNNSTIETSQLPDIAYILGIAAQTKIKHSPNYVAGSIDQPTNIVVYPKYKEKTPDYIPTKANTFPSETRAFKHFYYRQE